MEIESGSNCADKIFFFWEVLAEWKALILANSRRPQVLSVNANSRRPHALGVTVLKANSRRPHALSLLKANR